MSTLIKNISTLVTCRDLNGIPKSGGSQTQIGLLKNSNIFIEGSKISFVGNANELKSFLKVNKKKNFNEIDGKNKTVMPGFVDSHTHFVFAGSRADEYEMRIAGSTYQDIAKAGGGIAATVNAVRKSSKSVLRNEGEKKLKNFIEHGTTTLEGKSGYGLDTDNEIKMLEVINSLARKNKYDMNIVPTFLGAHSVPKDMPKEKFINKICYEMIPMIAQSKLARFIDVFCEKGYYSPEEAEKILTIGSKFGIIPKMHADQFTSSGGIEVALKVKAISVDHLEALSSSDIKRLQYKSVIATLLPGASYFLDMQYPPAREIIENDIPVAIATDFNPGSCMTENMQIIMSLASVKMKMTGEEILNAVTINAAYALYLQELVGSIEEGKQADILIFDFQNYRDLLYHFGVNQIEMVIKKGNIVVNNKK
jgi:imidazolonepropionase